LRRVILDSKHKHSFVQNIVELLKKNKIKVFALFMMNINRKITYNTQCDLNALDVFSINETTQNLKNIKAKLLLKYHEFLDVFD